MVTRVDLDLGRATAVVKRLEVRVLTSVGADEVARGAAVVARIGRIAAVWAKDATRTAAIWVARSPVADVLRLAVVPARAGGGD